MTYNVLMGTLNPTHSLTLSLCKNNKQHFMSNATTVHRIVDTEQ